MPNQGKYKQARGASFVVRKGAGGTCLAIMVRDEIEGDEHELFDLKTQLLARDGLRIIDNSLRIDADDDPPVYGWILYRELTNGERKSIRSRAAPVEDPGAGLS